MEHGTTIIIQILEVNRNSLPILSQNTEEPNDIIIMYQKKIKKSSHFSVQVDT